MPIRFRCQSCDARIKVPDGTEGKKVKCPRCGGTQRIPATSPPEPDDLPVKIPVARPRKSRPPEDDLGPAPSQTPTDDPLAALASAADAPSTEPPPAQTPDPGPEPEPEPATASSASADDDPLAALAAMTGNEPTDPPRADDSLFDDAPAAEPSLADELEPTADQRDASAVADALSDVEAKLTASPMQAPASTEDAPTSDEDDANDLAALAGASAEATADDDPAGEKPSDPPPTESSPTSPSGPRVSARPMPRPPQRLPIGAAARSDARPSNPAPRDRPQPQPHSPVRAARSSDTMQPASPTASIASALTAGATGAVAESSRRRPAPPPAMALLLVIAWVLRALAFLMVGGAVKLFLVARQHDWDLIASLSVLLASICLAGLTWAGGELAAGLRTLARRL